MNVVLLNYAFDRDLSGPEALLARYDTLGGWSEALLAAGARTVTVVQRFHRDDEVTRNGVRYLFRADAGEGRGGALPWLGRLHRTVAELNPDIVHVNGLDYPVQAWLLRRTVPSATAIVVQDHASGPPAVRGSLPAKYVKGAVRRRLMRAIDAFLFSAAELAESWRQAGFISPAQRVHEVMEASTTLRPMDRAVARDASGMDGAPSVLWVGRLNRNKDPLTVLEGFERSLTRLPGAVLTMIYGADDLLPLVDQTLRQSSTLARRVRLIGRVPHHLMPAYYGAADLFVLGSHHEGSGYALLEACACGVTPIVTSIPTFRAITGNGSVGALWMPDDASGCARALADAGHGDLMASRARVLEHFDRTLSWSAIGGRAMAAYRDVVERRRSG